MWVINFNGAAAYTLTIPILDDTLAEGHELFWITLSDPVNGLIVSPNPMSVLILDNECAFSPATGPERIESEDFDCGGEGVAYHDSTPGNSGSSSYRFGEDVDVWSSAAASQARYVGSTVAGEWLDYTVVLTETARYDIRLSAAALTATQVRLEIDGVDVTDSLTLAGTGGNENFFEVAAANGILLTSGPHQIRLFIITGGANFDYLALSPTPPEPVYLPLLLKPQP